MTVRITKPEFNIREKLSELDIPVGNHGTQLMKSSDVAETHNLLQLKNRRKNYFINGDCKIWQRGTSNPHVNHYTCDRWWRANGATQVDRSTDVPGYQADSSAHLHGTEAFNYSMKVTSNGSGSNIGQPIELTDTGVSQFGNGKQYTLSFYAKTDSGTGDVGMVLYYRNSKFSGTNQVNWEPNHTPHVGTMNRGWQRFVYTFTAPAVNANNTILAFELSFSVTAYFTGFQLEEGPQVTPFEFTNKAEELELCRRYFQQIKPGSAFMQFGVGFTYGNQADGNSILHVKLPTPMRALPAFSYLGNLNQYYEPHASTQTNITNMVLVQWDVDYKQFDIQVVGTTSTQKLMWIATFNNTATGFLFDAEL